MAEENKNPEVDLDTDGVNEQTVEVNEQPTETPEFEKKEDVDLGYTDITKDGTLKGVSLDQTVNFAKSISHPVIASGGVASLNDISILAKESLNGVQGVIIGRALYDKKFTFSDALQKTKQFKI